MTEYIRILLLLANAIEAEQKEESEAMKIPFLGRFLHQLYTNTPTPVLRL